MSLALAQKLVRRCKRWLQQGPRAQSQDNDLRGGEKREILYRAADLEIVFLTLSAAKGGKLNVVQVGANDGVTNDPVFSHFQRFAGRILLIEPQTSLLPALRKNYAHFSGDLIIENIAISPEEGALTLFELEQEAGRKYAEKTGFNPTGIASSRKDHLASHLADYEVVDQSKITGSIRTRVVPCQPLSKLLKVRSFTNIEFLQIDTEGSDWTVIESLEEIRPAAIQFEWVHLSPSDWAECLKWIADNRYFRFQGERDCLLLRDHSSCKSSTRRF